MKQSKKWRQLVRVEYQERLSSKGTIHYRTRVYLRCPLEHDFNTDLSNYRAGKGCTFCKGDRISESKKIPTSTIENIAISRGYTLIKIREALRGVPIGHPRDQRRVLLKCKQGHFWETVISTFIKGKHGCSECANRQSSKEQRISHKDVFTAIRQRGFIPLCLFWRKRQECRQNEAVVRFKCNQGHLSEITLGHFRGGRGCSTCGIKLGVERMTDTKRFFEQKFQSPEFDLVSNLQRVFGEERKAIIDSV